MLTFQACTTHGPSVPFHGGECLGCYHTAARWTTCPACNRRMVRGKKCPVCNVCTWHRKPYKGLKCPICQAVRARQRTIVNKVKVGVLTFLGLAMIVIVIAVFAFAGLVWDIPRLLAGIYLANGGVNIETVVILLMPISAILLVGALIWWFLFVFMQPKK